MATHRGTPRRWRPPRALRWAVVAAMVATAGLAGSIVGSGSLAWPSSAVGPEELEVARAEARTLDAGEAADDGIGRAPVDLLGRAVDAEAAPDRAPQAHRAGDGSTGRSAPEPSGRLRIADLGLDVPLGMIDRTPQVTPPGYRAAYVLRSEGLPPDPEQRTTVIAMHSLLRGTAPGNFLVSREGRVLARPGARVEALGRSWSIVTSEDVSKQDLPARTEVWGDHPGRLVLITCRQTGAMPTTANTVIIAELDPA